MSFETSHRGAARTGPRRGEKRRRLRRARIALAVVSCVAVSCGGNAGMHGHPAVECAAAGSDLCALARRFAPILMLHEREPYGVTEIFAVFHPVEPVIAYHIFFEDDVVLAGRGKPLDHETAWVKYDPVTLKTTEVFTLWHRTVLATEACVLNAKASGQRPRIDVQWGQHGLLPFGWETLTSARPRLEIRIHYEVARRLNRLATAKARERDVSFEGIYADYVTFSVRLDTADLIDESRVVKAGRSREFLRARLGDTFLLKKEWPDW